MSVSPSNFGLTGFAFPVVSGSGDFPAESDVRDGVDYDDGDMTGTLTLPTAGNVRQGIGYGAGGTEFTGTLRTTSTGGSGGSTSRARVVRSPLAAILSAVQAEIMLRTGLPEECVVILGRFDIPPPLQADQDILLRLGGFQSVPGNRDRHDRRVKRRLYVIVRTRVQLDPTNSDELLLTDADRGLTLLEESVEDALQDFTPASDAGDDLTYQSIDILSTSDPDHTKKAKGWGESVITAELPIALPLDITRF